MKLICFEDILLFLGEGCLYISPYNWYSTLNTRVHTYSHIICISPYNGKGSEYAHGFRFEWTSIHLFNFFISFRIFMFYIRIIIMVSNFLTQLNLQFRFWVRNDIAVDHQRVFYQFHGFYIDERFPIGCTGWSGFCTWSKT